MIDSQPKLVVMVGLPRSGKTTFVNKYYIPQGYAVVCPDNIRLALHGSRFIASAEPFVWAIVYVMVDALLLSGNKVVVDSCFCTAVHREPFFKRGAYFKHIDTSKEECIKRAKNDIEIIHIIEKMNSEFQEPVNAQ